MTYLTILTPLSLSTMTASEKKIIFTELRQMLNEVREETKAEIRREIKAVSREIYEVLTGLGVLESDEKRLTKAQVMKMYGVGKSKVESMMADGTLPFTKEGEHRQAPVFFRYADARIAFETSKR